MSICTEARYCLTPLGQQMVEQNLPLALAIVKKSAAGRWMPLDDRRQAAIEGLIRAVAGFDFEHGAKFSTYACRAIFHWLSRVAQCDGLVRVPLYAQRPRKADDEALAASVSQARSVFSIHRADDGHPIDLPAREDGSEDAEARAADREALWAAIRDLPPRYRWVVAERARGKTLESIGRYMGISKERARQIESKGIELIRARLRGESGRSWSDSLRARP